MAPGEVRLRMLASIAGGTALLLAAAAWHLAGGADASPRGDARATDANPSPTGLAFESNQGQADPWVRFIARGNGFALRLEDTGAVVRLPGSEVHLAIAGLHRARASGAGRLPGASHYFMGNDPGRWQRDVPLHGQVRFIGIHEGIDLEFRGHAGRLELGFAFAPGSTPGLVAFDIGGAGEVALDAAGDLALSAGASTLRLHRPLAYQVVDGARHPVDSRYWQLDDDTVAMAFGRYDRSLPLVVVPVLAFPVADAADRAGPWPGAAQATEVDATGAVWAVGRALSATGHGDEGDAFACRLGATSAAPECAYIGGSEADAALALAIGPRGAAHVVGTTRSGDFPLVAAQQRRRAGASDAFALSLGPQFDQLAFSTYLGGNGIDVARGVAVDATGTTWVTGETSSTRGFPTTPGALQVADPPGDDAFVAKFTRGGALVFATYLGGSADDGGNRIALDEDGHAYVSGHTASAAFPSRVPTGDVAGGGPRAFQAKLHRDGASLLYGTYLADAGGGHEAARDARD